MSRQKEFLTWIFSKRKRPYYTTPTAVLEADINTHMTPDGDLAYLESEPTGWKDNKVAYGRNITYWGIFREFAASLVFGLESARILKHIIWNEGYEAEAFIAIHQLNRTKYPYDYEQWFMGELDFTKFKQNNSTVSILTIAGGMSKYLKAYENTTYELPFTDPQAVDLYLDGFPFVNKLEYDVFPDQQFNGANESQIATGIIAQEGSTQGVLAQDEQYVQTGIVFPDENWIFRSYSKYITLNVTGNLSVDMGGSRTFPLFLRKFKVVNGVSIASTYYPFSVASFGTGIQNISYDINIPVEPNERIYLVAQGLIGSPGVVFTVRSGTMKMTYDVTFTPTLHKAFKLKRIAELLVDKMSGGRYQCSSAFLDAIDDIVYTSGTALRNVNSPVLKISFTDFYKSLKGLDYDNRTGVGVGIENDKLVIENLLHFFQPVEILELGIADNLSINVAEDLIYNTIKVGYANQTYDKVNGLDEVNVTQQYTTDILKEVKDLDLIDPVRADATGIELARLSLFKQDTTDSKSDNDTFKVSVTQGGTLEYYNGPYEVIGGALVLPGRIDGINGTLISVPPLGVLTVTNTSYLVVGYTYITVSVPPPDGVYAGQITYYSATTFIPKRLAYSAISGILQPAKKYNIEFSPKRMLLNQGAQLHSFIEAGNIHFQTGEKNSELSTTYNGETITEKADVEVANLAPKLYLPYYIEFDCEVPVDFKKTMDLNPYGLVKVSWNSNDVYGYLFDGSITPATNDKQKFKLLLAPNNNLKNFIN